MTEQRRSLRGKVAIVTGGARGIGRATAAALGARGARVAIGDLDLELAEQTAAEIGGGAIGSQLDVTDRIGYAAFLDRVERELGPIDIVINNAGIGPLSAFDEESDASTGRMVSVNLLAVMYGTREAMRRMKPRRSGHIVNVASAAGKVAVPYATTYSATKFGVVGFCEGVAGELRGTGVDISCVCPSVVNTEFSAGVPRVPGFKMIEPEDVAREIVDALEKPRFSVPVPRALGIILNLTQALPYRARAFLAQRSATATKNPDPSARRDYEARAAREIAADRVGEPRHVGPPAAA
jgi:short-subunit dehydrogenase